MGWWLGRGRTALSWEPQTWYQGFLLQCDCTKMCNLVPGLTLPSLSSLSREKSTCSGLCSQTTVIYAPSLPAALELGDVGGKPRSQIGRGIFSANRVRGLMHELANETSSPDFHFCSLRLYAATIVTASLIGDSRSGKGGGRGG